MDKDDPNWTIHNDCQSVTVGINTRIWLLRRQRMVPTLIRLGHKHTRLFLREAAMQCIPSRKPRRIYHQGLFWDDEHSCLCYSKKMIPIRFNDPKIHGIAVEGEPKSKKNNAPHSS